MPSERERILRLLKKEQVRVNTFQNWSSQVQPCELAKAGFFYFNQSDSVQCAFCLGVIENWEPDDQPLQEHILKFPRCPFVLGLPVGNIPIHQQNITPDESAILTEPYTSTVLLRSLEGEFSEKNILSF